MASTSCFSAPFSDAKGVEFVGCTIGGCPKVLRSKSHAAIQRHEEQHKTAAKNLSHLLPVPTTKSNQSAEATLKKENEGLKRDNRKLKKEAEKTQRKAELETQKTKKLKEMIAQLEKEKEEAEASNECGFCFSASMEVAFRPCGHRLCRQCAGKINICHVCRSRIFDKIRLY